MLFIGGPNCVPSHAAAELLVAACGSVAIGGRQQPELNSALWLAMASKLLRCNS